MRAFFRSHPHPGPFRGGSGPGCRCAHRHRGFRGSGPAHLHPAARRTKRSGAGANARRPVFRRRFGPARASRSGGDGPANKTVCSSGATSPPVFPATRTPIPPGYAPAYSRTIEPNATATGWGMTMFEPEGSTASAGEAPGRSAAMRLVPTWKGNLLIFGLLIFMVLSYFFLAGP